MGWMIRRLGGRFGLEGFFFAGELGLKRWDAQYHVTRSFAA